jgi:hypothetical protein
MFYSEGEKMTFAEAVNKYNCYARDVLGLVGELDIPCPHMSKKIEFPLDPGRVHWLLKDSQDKKIGLVDSKRGTVL